MHVVHCGSTRQTATILSMNMDHLRTGDKASCLFRFIKNPEYIRPDTRMVFREGRTKAIGTITKVFPYVPGPGVAASTKKKPSQIPKTASGTSLGRVKGRRGCGDKGRPYFVDKTVVD